jgi:hypothetical protein
MVIEGMTMENRIVATILADQNQAMASLFSDIKMLRRLLSDRVPMDRVRLTKRLMTCVAILDEMERKLVP